VGGFDTRSLAVVLAVGVAGALVAFLRFNFPPARIYLGDGGAYFLGFLIGLLAMRQSQKGAVVAALVAPLFALALPIIDVTLAILRRALRGLPVFRPDRKHLHHKLLGEGFSRRKTVLVLYGFSVICLLMAFGVYWSKGRWAPIFLGLVSLLILVTASRLNFARPWLSPANVLGSTLEVRKAAQYALALCQWFELEAERSPSLEALWGDFEFVVRKLGMARVCVETAAGPKVWEATVPIQEAAKFQCTLLLNHAVYRQIEFVADTGRMSDKVFDQLTELAAESWIKGVTRWHSINKSS
jgi:UDP-GlcNAc:undecaprenyl-phosphate GlcNAc-1-phosphate transferase